MSYISKYFLSKINKPQPKKSTQRMVYDEQGNVIRIETEGDEPASQPVK